MRVIRLDPDMTTVDAVALPDAELLAAIAREVGEDYVRLPAAKGHVLLARKGYARHDERGFFLSQLPCVTGTALLLGHEPGGFTDATVTVEDVADHIRWTDGAVVFSSN